MKNKKVKFNKIKFNDNYWKYVEAMLREDSPNSQWYE